MSHGLSQGCSSGAAGPVVAVCAQLWALLACRGCLSSVSCCVVIVGPDRYNPVPFCSAVCLPHALQEVDFRFCYPYCCCRYCPSSQLLHVGCFQHELLLLSLLPVTSCAASPFQQLVWFCWSDTTHGFISACRQKNSTVAFLYHMGLGCQGLPLPTNLTSIS